MEKKFSGLVADLGNALPTHGQMFDIGREDDKEFFKNQVQSPNTIFSSNQALPALGQFLGQADQQGLFDPAKDFARQFVQKNIFKKEKEDSNENILETNMNKKDESKNFLNKFKPNINVGLSGFNLEKQFGDSDQGLYGGLNVNQRFGGDTTVGGNVGLRKGAADFNVGADSKGGLTAKAGLSLSF